MIMVIWCLHFQSYTPMTIWHYTCIPISVWLHIFLWSESVRTTLIWFNPPLLFIFSRVMPWTITYVSAIHPAFAMPIHFANDTFLSFWVHYLCYRVLNSGLRYLFLQMMTLTLIVSPSHVHWLGWLVFWAFFFAWCAAGPFEATNSFYRYLI